MQLRQRVIATASTYFHRFYSKNAYATTDPFLVLTACVYLAAKVEESAIRIRTLTAEASKMFGELGYHELPNSVAMVAEMEFYLLDELEFDLIVSHPYTTLERLCPACSKVMASTYDRPTTPEDTRNRNHALLQMTWFVANDLYRTDLPLLHPPYVLAIVCLYLALVLLPSSSDLIQTALAGTHSSALVTFLAGLNVSMPLVTQVAQEMLAQYALWDQLHHPGPSGGASLLHDHAGIFARVRRMHAARRATLLDHAVPPVYTS